MIKKISALLTVFMIAASAFCAGSKESAALDEKIRIAVMPDAGALPFYLMDSVEPVPFMSARERDTAMQLEELDGMMSDLISILLFHQNGMNLKILTLNESRFLIVGSETFKRDQQWSIGISENSIIEFMVDQLAAEELASNRLDKVAIPSVPVRLEMLRSGQVPLACLTEAMAWTLPKDSFPIVRDQKGSGLEPAVLVFAESFVAENPEKIEVFKKEWNEAAALINNDPESYRSLLLEQLRLPEDETRPYPIPEYRQIILPSEQTYAKVVEWFNSKYGKADRPEYDNIVIH